MEASKAVDPCLFSEFNLSLSADEALTALYTLSEKRAITQPEFRALLNRSREPDVIDSNLRAIRFVEGDQTWTEITSDGEEYLSLFS
jgi:hypothetical protein